MRTFRLLSLCTGIGVIDYVWSSLLGQQIAGQIEINPYCTALLAMRFAGVPHAYDINEVATYAERLFGAVDVVAGGIPCQPFSYAGKRGGAHDDRHLWPSALAIITLYQPRWVLIENVAGFISLALDLVQADLESAGYTTQAYVLPACAVGAPHRRERVFVVAHANGTRQWERSDQSQRQHQCTGTAHPGIDGTQGPVADTDRTGSQIGDGSATTRRACASLDGCGARQSQSGVGRVANGATYWLDSPRWPARPGDTPDAWEPSRTITFREKNRTNRLKALGNAIVPQQVYPFLSFMVENLQEEVHP